jgi:tetratricopeptide (TPR) repeat protein
MMRSNRSLLGRRARPMSATVTSILVVLVLAFVRVAHVAAQSRPTGDPKALADQYAEAGVLAQKNGDYKTAIELFERANTLVPHPVFLYDIAQAHRLASAALRDSDPAAAAEHRDVARGYYRQFIDTHPGEDFEIKAQGWLSKLDQQRAEEDRKREAAIQAEQARISAERKRQAEAQERINVALRQKAFEEARRRARSFGILGISAVGAGLVGSGFGVYYGLQARKYSDRISSIPAGGAYDSATYAAGRTADQRMMIAYAIGVPLLVGGGVSLAYAIRIYPKDSLSIAPQAIPGRVGLVVIGHF